MSKDNIVGIRWSDGQLQVSFLNRPIYESRVKPSIPDVEFDAFLHCDFYTGQTTAVHEGVTRNLTNKEVDRCRAYAAGIDFPVYTYDDKECCLFSGVSTMAKAKVDGVKFTEERPTSHDSFYDESEGVWRRLYAALTVEGVPVLQASNYRSITQDSDVVYARVFDIETWELFSRKRPNDTALFDFEKNRWKDDSTMEELLYNGIRDIGSLVEELKVSYKEDLVDWHIVPDDFDSLTDEQVEELSKDIDVEAIDEMMNEHLNQMGIYQSVVKQLNFKVVELLMHLQVSADSVDSILGILGSKREKLDNLDDYLKNVIVDVPEPEPIPEPTPEPEPIPEPEATEDPEIEEVPTEEEDIEEELDIDVEEVEVEEVEIIEEEDEKK